MTTCSRLFEIFKPYVETNDYNGFLEKYNSVCGGSPNHAREYWNGTKIYTSLQICSNDVKKIAEDSFRELAKKEHQSVLPEVLPKIRSFIKNGQSLTKLKTQEFIDKAKGVPKLPSQPRFYECENCLQGTTSPVRKNSHLYCSEKCASEGFQKAQAKTKKKTLGPTEKWEDRARKMHPKVSKMEEYMRVVLTEKGVPFKTDEDYCVQVTRPDFVFPHANLAVYLDGERVHRNTESRDNFLRHRLAQRYGFQVLAVTYPDTTQKSKDEVLARIMEAIE